jgi:predicted Zn finger-like uncharacterized protein
MIIVCPSCGARYKFDETKLGQRPRAKTKCAKCGGTIEIENPLVGAMTLPPGAFAPEGSSPEGNDTRPAEPQVAAPESDPRQRTHRSLSAAAAPEVGGSTLAGRDLHKLGVVELPKDRRYSLAVLQGPATGHIFPITKVRTTIGRAGADINIDDPEASRTHAAVEILGDHAMLRDLGSTNGTFVDVEKIESHVLNNQMEFRIGSHVLMFIVTEVE